MTKNPVGRPRKYRSPLNITISDKQFKAIGILTAFGGAKDISDALEIAAIAEAKRVIETQGVENSGYCTTNPLHMFVGDKTTVR